MREMEKLPAPQNRKNRTRNRRAIRIMFYGVPMFYQWLYGTHYPIANTYALRLCTVHTLYGFAA